MAHILIIDNEVQMRRFLRRELVARGFRVYEASTAQEGIRKAQNLHPYLILQDLSLPDMDGIGVVKTLRSNSSAPIVAFADLRTSAAVPTALESGADDCVIKPFGILELVTRIEVAILQAMRLFPTAYFRNGEICFDPITGKLSAGSETVQLTPTEYAVMRVLVRHSGNVVSYDRLLSEIGRPKGNGGRNLLRVYISKIRSLIENHSGEEALLTTIPGVGYCLRRRN